MQPTQQIWLKKVLIPLWTIQFVCYIIIFASACLALVVVGELMDGSYDYDEAQSAIR